MARRTKEDAEKTRQRILAAARRVFARRGVSRTSLDQIARAAQVTRGAIYWHFESKADLFFAMRGQILLPLYDQLPDERLPPGSDPLDGIAAFILEVMRRLRDDPQVRQTCEIICNKCEYVDEFEAVLDQMLGCCAELIGHLARAYRLAAQRGYLRPDADPEALAMDTYLFYAGLVRLCVSDKDGRVLPGPIEGLIAAHVALRRK